MNIKLDENLPERLVSELRALGHVVDTVRTEHLAGRDDTDIWQAAQSVDRFLITQDLDFSDVRRYTPGTHAGLLWCASYGLVGMPWAPA
jgi:predicted nuclease of predicted toxin-antitoxin system